MAPRRGPSGVSRVLVACDWYLKYAAGYALGLREQGADVALLCRTHAFEFGGGAEERDVLLERLRRADVELFLLQGRISSVAALPQASGLRRAIRRWGPEIVHVQENHDPRILLLARGFPLVYTVHDPIPHPGAPVIGGVGAAVLKAWLRRADRVIVHGDRLRPLLPSWLPPARVAVINHGTWVRETPLPPPEQRAVLLFGRLERYKGVQVLCEAMELVWRSRPEVKLVVRGEGPAAAALPDDPRIEASIGYLPENALEGMFANASLVVLPYLEGSQSGVGAQAVGNGVPVIVSDVGALPTLALDRSFVVRPADPRDLAAAIVRHLDDGLDVRRRTLRFAERELSWTALARRGLDLYEGVLMRTPAPG